MKKSMPHSQLIKNLKKELTDEEDQSPNDSKRTLNLKEKLRPIELNKKNQGELEEMRVLPRLPKGNKEDSPSSHEYLSAM
jgi:hypothetical protein